MKNRFKLIVIIGTFSLLSTYAQNNVANDNRQESRRQIQENEKRQGGNKGQGNNRGQKGDRKQKVFDMKQTLSSGAQINTIAFSALAFYTGSLYSSSFYPPGKVADFFGFQYMRDNDSSESGHNTDFLTKAAWHTMHILDNEQMQILIDLAKDQENLFKDYALKRLVLISAFHRSLEGDLPNGKTMLDFEQVKNVSKELYLIDGEISYGRALAFGKVINSLRPEQVEVLQKMGKEGMQTWTMPEKPRLQIPRGLNVWVMSNASEMFSWYLRDIDADVYFCPERQGTYFGGFFMKDAPAVGNPGYAIDPQATASKGSTMLKSILSPDQSEKIKGIYPRITSVLDDIVEVRTNISKELRKAITNGIVDEEKIKELSARYGELDGEYIYEMAKTFSDVGKTLSEKQKNDMFALRDLNLFPDKEGKVFMYSREIDMPQIPNTDFLFK